MLLMFLLGAVAGVIVWLVANSWWNWGVDAWDRFNVVETKVYSLDRDMAAVRKELWGGNNATKG